MAEGGTCQDTETNRPTEAHSPTRDSRGRDLSGHGNKLTNRGALTSWRQQRKGLVRTWKKPAYRGTLTSWRRQREGLVRTPKGTDRARHTHILETAEGGTCQDTERNPSTEAHSLSGDGRGRDLSGHSKKPTDQGALTSWRQQREGLCEDTERNRPSDEHSLPGDGRGRDLSGYRNKPTERGGTHFLETVDGGTC